MRVFGIGETVLDIIFEHDQPVSAKAGGSVLNASISLGRLGVDVYFISDYGQDKVGDSIDSFLKQNNVSTRYVQRFTRHRSAIALAFLDEKQNADYSFYKDFPEKRLEGLKVNFLADDIVLFGSFFAISESIKDTLKSLLSIAEKAGATIIYDPNFRKPHLKELPQVKPRIIKNISCATLVKGSDEDFRLIFDAKNSSEAYKTITGYGCKYLVYTRGAGDVTFMGPGIEFSTAVPKITPVSTIGAGDNFNAGIVYSLLAFKNHGMEIPDLKEEEWKLVIQNGIVFSSHVCTSYENYISKDFAQQFIT